MKGSAQYSAQLGIVCRICAGPISLENSKTDESGKAVHEQCYVRQTISRFRTAGVAIMPLFSDEPEPMPPQWPELTCTRLTLR
jgi:hypothetical protein